jgi:adenylyltransferase/sulfurtransferase
MADVPIEIDCQTVKARLDAGEDFALVDCREQDEYDFVRIAGAALIPMSEIAQRASELTSFGDRPVVIHCHHGGRSLRVAMWLRQQGVARAQSMSGGIDAWAAEIDPTLPRY